jgi:hypothetical protein
MPTLNPNIPEILTLIIAPIFSIFSADWSAKIYTNKAPPKDKSQFN